VAIENPEWAPLDPTQRRWQTLEALKRLLMRESQVQRVLLVVEDLHWIDSETQAFLDLLVDSLPTSQMLLLVNYRPEYTHGWGNKMYYQQVQLDALPATSAQELLDALFVTDPALAHLRRLLIERTQGNPFFLEESVRVASLRKTSDFCRRQRWLARTYPWPCYKRSPRRRRRAFVNRSPGCRPRNSCTKHDSSQSSNTRSSTR